VGLIVSFWLKSALGGIETPPILPAFIISSALKSALGGIETDILPEIYYFTFVVKISPWRD